MTTGPNAILAVIDPTRREQWALRKSISIARDRGDPQVYAFVCAHSEAECDDPSELRSVEIERHSAWLTELLEPFSEDGVEIIPMIEWNSNWPKATADAAANAGVSLVVKRASGRPESLTSSDRELIRSLGCALLLVKHDPAREMRKVLVAVDFNATDDDHVGLNDSIIELGKQIRGSNEEIELHAVSAYPQSDKFAHPPDVAKRLDVDRPNAHVQHGSAIDVIPKIANKIDPDLVIVGSVGRRGIAGITVGNTSEKILAGINSDVLVLVRAAEAERSTA